MFVVRIVCLSLCVCLVLYAYSQQYVEKYKDVTCYKQMKPNTQPDDMEQLIKAFFEPTELYGKNIMTDNNVVTYARALKGMSREASDMAQSVTGESTNRVKESGAHAQMVQQTSTDLAIKSHDTTISGTPT